MALVSIVYAKVMMNLKIKLGNLALGLSTWWPRQWLWPHFQVSLWATDQVDILWL